jgi:hypothetical protein
VNIEKSKKLPRQCPSCGSRLSVRRLQCGNCETAVEGDFNLPLLASLSDEEQNFILSFIKASGSLKEMASQMGLSYPTVRNYLDELIGRIKEFEGKKK